MDRISEILLQGNLWTWLSILLLFVTFEVLLASGYLLGVIVAAALLTLLHLIGVDPSWLVDITLFSVLAIGFTFLSRRFMKPILDEDAAKDLNNLSRTLVGKTVTAKTDFENGRGSVRLGDTDWLARCENENMEVKEAEQLIVEEVESSTLIVRQV